MTEFANRFVRSTIENASSKPFYQQFWREVDINAVKTVGDFTILPVLDKPSAVRFLAEYAFSETPALLSHSTGTGSGEITLRCRSQAEISCLWDLCSSGRTPPSVPTTIRPLGLIVACANHGQTIPLPGDAFSLRATGFDRDVLDHVCQQVTRSYNIPGYSERVKTITATPAFIKTLTMTLLSRGIDPATLGVDHLFTFGEYIPAFWIRRLESWWGAQLFDRYSSSELIGGARRCRACGWMSFDPVSWPEVVALSDRRTVNEGIGSLVVTELYPFSQLQPLVRFEVGDLVEVRQHACDGTPGQTFRFLGRKSMSLVDEFDPTTVLLYSAEVAEVLEERPELRRSEHYHSMVVDGWTRSLAPPLARTLVRREGSKSIVEVQVAPQFSPSVFTDAADILRKELEHRLLERCTSLKQRLESSTLHLQVTLLDDASNLKPYGGS